MYGQTIIEGILLSEKKHSVVYEVRFEALGHDRCICKIATEYHLKEGVVFKEEDETEFDRHRAAMLYSAIVEYLIRNPGAYT